MASPSSERPRATVRLKLARGWHHGLHELRASSATLHAAGCTRSQEWVLLGGVVPCVAVVEAGVAEGAVVVSGWMLRQLRAAEDATEVRLERHPTASDGASPQADAADAAFVAAAAAASAFLDDAVDNDAASAAAADAFVDDAASVDTSVCSERQTEWVWRSGLDVSECVDDWGWEDALAERKKRLLAEFVGDD